MKSPYKTPKHAAAQLVAMKTSADCYPAGVLGILREVKRRLKIEGRLWTYAHTCRLVGCIDGGPTFYREGLEDDLREAAKEFYLEVVLETTGSGSGPKRLAEVCDDPLTSFPLVSLHPGFLNDKYPDHFPDKGREEHVVVVLDVHPKTLTVTYADPILPVIEPGTEMKDAVREMSAMDLTRYWKPTFEPFWALHFVQPRQRKLESFQGGA